MKSVEQLCWVLTGFAAVFSAFRVLMLALSNGVSAPQYAAEAAGICAGVIVPYVLARAVQGFRQTS